MSQMTNRITKRPSKFITNLLHVKNYFTLIFLAHFMPDHRVNQPLSYVVYFAG